MPQVERTSSLKTVVLVIVTLIIMLGVGYFIGALF